MKRPLKNIVVAITIVAMSVIIAVFIPGPKTSVHIVFWGTFLGYMPLGQAFLGREKNSEKKANDFLLNFSTGLVAGLLVAFIILHLNVLDALYFLRWSILIGALILYAAVSLGISETKEDEVRKKKKGLDHRFTLINNLIFVAIMMIMASLINLFIDAKFAIFYIVMTISIITVVSSIYNYDERYFDYILNTLMSSFVLISGIFIFIAVDDFSPIMSLPTWLPPKDVVPLWMPITGAISMVFTAYYNYAVRSKKNNARITELQEE